MTVSKAAAVDSTKASRSLRKDAADEVGEAGIELGELSELLGYLLKRAQLRVFEDFLNCVAPLQLTPAQFSVLLLLDRNPGRNLCTRVRSTNDRRSHILALTDKGRAVLARAKKLVASKHEARLNELLGPG